MLVTIAARMATEPATARKPNRSRPRPARRRRLHVQNRFTAKLTAAPAANAANVAIRGPAWAPRYTNGKTTALVTVASSEPATKRSSFLMSRAYCRLVAHDEAALH